MRIALMFGSVVLAAGVAAGGWFVGNALVESRQPERIVTVKGLAERDVLANLGFWPIRFVATGPNLDLARTRLEEAEGHVRSFLGGKGFTDAAIEVQNILVEDRYAGYNAGATPDEVRFVLTEDLLVTSEDVEALASAARDVGDLLQSGVVFSSDAWSAGPSFVFTGINDLKGEMLSEATQRAREAAETFATEASASVGSIKTANQGVFEINPAVDIPNSRPEKQIAKKVRVVTTITYFLTD